MDEQLKQEAIRKLEAYAKTGMSGFRQQAIDRLVAMGFNPARDMSQHEARVIIDELKAI